MLQRHVRRAFIAVAISCSFASAQAPAQPEQGPKVGDMAPDFTLRGATKDGLLTAPVTLSALRGQTVVVAFFPRARTSGCTAQMTTYRDRWSELFNGGKGVQVIAISMDADTTQANWAKEADLPMTFASDVGGAVGRRFGSLAEGRNFELRYLYVVGPDGRITYTAKQFRPMVDDSYAELGSAVKKTAVLK